MCVYFCGFFTICVFGFMQVCVKKLGQPKLSVLLSVLSDMAAVSLTVIMRPQGAANSGTVTWREEEYSESGE